MQDDWPGMPIGQCIAALGYLSWAEVKEQLERWRALEVVLV